MNSSTFLADSTDSALLHFLQQGRRPDDPASKLKLLMPPRGNPPLNDAGLERVIAYLRTLNTTGSQSARLQ